MRNTVGSASISSQIPREIACRKVNSGISLPPGSELDDAVVFEHALIRVFARRRGGGLGKLDGVVNRRLQPGADLLLLPAAPLQFSFEARARILLLPFLEELGRDVG